MPDDRTLHELPHGPLTALVAVRVTADGLVEHTRLGTRPLTPWAWVRGAAWLADGGARIRTNIHTIDLPAGTERLGELMANIDRLAAAASAAVLASSLDAERIAQQLGTTDGTLWRQPPQQPGSGTPFAVGAILLLAVSVTLGAAYAALMLLVCGLALLWVRTVPARPMSHHPPLVSADGHLLYWSTDGAEHQVPWREVLEAGVYYDHRLGRRWAHLRLRTVFSIHKLSAPAAGLEPVLAILERVVKTRNDRFQPAGAQPPSARSLSPARLTSDDAGRGLTQVERGAEP